MARNRTNTIVLEMRGAFRKHPERKKEREGEPVVTEPLGDCPEYLSEPEQHAWADIVSTAPTGVLKRSDSIAVEKAASLLALSRQWVVVEDCTGQRYATRPMTDGQHSQLISLLSKFGMTPADRSKVSVVKEPKLNRFAAVSGK